MTDRALDPLGLEDLVAPEDREVARSVRTFCERRVLPEIAAWYEEGHFPRHLVPELAELGLLGMQISGYGCAGAPPTAYGLACRELEAADSALRSFVSVQGSLAMFAIHRFGSEEQRERWLPAMARGEVIGCFALTEPDSGSDPGSMRTRARREGQDWILTGSKMWITNGSIADVAVVWARAEEGVLGFLVTRGTPGFQAVDIVRKLALRASVTSTLTLDSVRLPDSSRLGAALGLSAPLACLDEARLGIAFGALGAGRACYEAALSHALHREQFGRPIAGFQLTQRKLVDMRLALDQAGLLALHLARLKERGELGAAQISMGKLASVRAAREIALSARSILGAAGVTLDHPVIRHLNNLEAVFTYEGTDEVHTLSLGRHLTGLSAFR